MRVLVCGGRDYIDASALWGALDKLRHEAAHDGMTVIQGGARGADQLAREWCVARLVPYLNFPADWIKYGKAAGPIRNQQMIDKGEPTLVLAFPGGPGTADMLFRAENACIPVKRII